MNEGAQGNIIKGLRRLDVRKRYIKNTSYFLLDCCYFC